MTMTAAKVAGNCVPFESFFIMINMGVQIFRLFACKAPYLVKLSVLIGRGPVLALRYLLESRYIFASKRYIIFHDWNLFVRYSFMGILTTASLGGIEFAFHLIFTTKTIRYVGGLSGMAMVFNVEYQLDKKYMFVSDQKRGSL
jgi:hypothetical protein